jgi:hypothetical protein
MGDNDVWLRTLGECYGHLQSVDNDLIHLAANWLLEFYAQPFSIEVLMVFVRDNPDVIARRSALLGLSKAMAATWGSLPAASQGELFSVFLHMLTHEVDWLNRQHILEAVRSVMVPAFQETVVDFVTQTGESRDDAYVEIALFGASLLPLADFEPLVQGVNELLDRGFHSAQPLVRLAAFQFVLYCDYFRSPTFFRSFPQYWDLVIETFDRFVTTKFQLNRIVSLLNYTILERLCAEFPVSLVDKVLEFVSQNQGNTKAADSLRQVRTILEAICQVFPQEVIESGRLEPIVRLYVEMSCALFDPADQYAVTDAKVFEPIVQSLSLREEVSAELFAIVVPLEGTLPGQFLLVRLIGLAPTPNDIQQKVDLVKASLSNDSTLIREAAAKTTEELLKFFGNSRQEFADEMLPVVFAACHHFPSCELMDLGTRLLEVIAKTDDVFNQIYLFALDQLMHGTLALQFSALRCLAALAQGSTLKIEQYSERLMQLLLGILSEGSESADGLKAPAIDCISKLSQLLTINSYIPQLFDFLVPNIENEDLSLAIACLNGIEVVTWNHPDAVQPVLDTILPKLQERATADFSEEFLRSLSREDHIPNSAFSVTAISLRILAKFIIKFPALFDDLSTALFDLCNVHKRSTSPKVRIAVAETVCCLTESASTQWDNAKMDDEAQASGVKRLCEILIGMCSSSADPDVLCSVLHAASVLIDFRGYDDIEEFLGFFVETARHVILTESVQEAIQSGTPVALFDPLLEFTSSLCGSARSAGDQAFKFLEPLIEPFLSFTRAASLTYRVIALRFLGTLPLKCNPELTTSTVKFAMAMAATELEATPFHVLFNVIRYGRTFIEEESEEICRVFIQRLNERFTKSERILRFRDACVSCLVELASAWIRDPANELVSPELFTAVLGALPLNVDFMEGAINSVVLFLTDARERLVSEFPAEYTRVLAEWLGNSDLMIRRMNMDEPGLRFVRTELRAMLASAPDAEAACGAILGGDPLRLECVRKNLEVLSDAAAVPQDDAADGEGELPPEDLPKGEEDLGSE